MKVKLKKDDEVMVLSGKDKGKKGKIEKILPRTGRVIVAGVNIYKKHAKSKGQQKENGIINIIKPVPLSSVGLICSKCKEVTRIGFKISENKKQRICKKCKEII